jgi:hypothetical protein
MSGFSRDLRALYAHGYGPLQATFDASGERALVLWRDTLFTFDCETGDMLDEACLYAVHEPDPDFDFEGYPSILRAGPDGRFVFAAYRPWSNPSIISLVDRVVLLDLRAHSMVEVEVERRSEGFESELSAAAFSGDGSHLFGVERNGLHHWELGGSERYTFTPSPDTRDRPHVHALCSLARRERLACVSRDDVRRWDYARHADDGVFLAPSGRWLTSHVAATPDDAHLRVIAQVDRRGNDRHCLLDLDLGTGAWTELALIHGAPLWLSPDGNEFWERNRAGLRGQTVAPRRAWYFELAGASVRSPSDLLAVRSDGQRVITQRGDAGVEVAGIRAFKS